jgi:NlpC/P60 family
MQDSVQIASTTQPRSSVRLGRGRWSRRRALRGGSDTVTVILLAGVMLLGTLVAPASSATFVEQKELVALGARVPQYEALARRLQDDALTDVASKGPSGRLVDATLWLPSWRYLLALTAVQCNGDFSRADPERIYRFVRSSISYTYTPSDPGRVRATSTYPPVEVAAAKLATSGGTHVRMRPGAASKRCLNVISALQEGGLSQGESDPATRFRTGSLPLSRRILGKPDADGVAVHFSPVAYALKYRGVPYVWGGMSPSGFDCSGLVCYVMQQYGASSGHHHTTAEMWNTLGTPVSRSKIKPGDMIFWDKGHIHHVGMYVGGGKYIEAPYAGGHVRLSRLASRSSTIASIRRPHWQSFVILPTE